MNSYLVRIYRKAEDNPRVLVGVVEEVGKKEKKAFNSLNELWDILNQRKELKKRKPGTDNIDARLWKFPPFSPRYSVNSDQ